MTSNKSKLTELQELVAELRDHERGDPWTIVQTFKSMAVLTIEESYELADSIDQGNQSEILSEISDLMLHVAVYAQLGKELNLFDLETIAGKAVEKQLRRRHTPDTHVAITAADALAQWERKKLAEKKQRAEGQVISALDGIAHALPAINRALKLQNQAATVGFDWPNPPPILDKIDEEIIELKENIENNTPKEHIEDELGDVFFALINLARKLEIDPESALRHANNKFERRFRQVESDIAKDNKATTEMTLDQLDQYWNAVKNNER